MINRVVPAVVLLVVLVVVGAGGAVVAQNGNPASTYCAGEAEMTVLRRVNQLRGEHGLEPLTLSKPLGIAAEQKALEMAEEGYLAHESPGGQGPRELLAAVGYTYNTPIGENIAAGHESGDATFEQWLNSPEHREIMLGEQFTAIGIGRAHNPDTKYDWYWAAEFGGEVGSPAQPCNGTPVALPNAEATPFQLVCDVLSHENNRYELSCRELSDDAPA